MATEPEGSSAPYAYVSVQEGPRNAIPRNTNAHAPTRIVIRSYYPMMLAGIGAAIAAEYPDASVEHAETLSDVRHCLAGRGADLVILHLKHTGSAKRLELHELRTSYADIKVLVVAPQDDRETALWCLAAGAHGVVGPSVSQPQLQEALRMVMTGHVHVPSALAVLPKNDVHAPPGGSTNHVSLTPRQNEVLRLLAAGQSNKQIARQLGLGVGTVKIHLAHLFTALGARSRLEAIVKSGAVRHPTREAA